MFEKPASREVFCKPDIQAEKGEFERVGQLFGIDDSALLFLAQDGNLQPLDEDTWSQLGNTDSYSIPQDGHDIAEEHAAAAGKDYRSVAEAMYAGVASGEPIDAPIIMKFGNQYHLVSGNTRLMAARAYGAAPQVWVFEVADNEA